MQTRCITSQSRSKYVEQKLQVCENNWVRRITRTKSVNRRRKNDLRKEVGMQCSLTGRLAIKDVQPRYTFYQNLHPCFLLPLP